ncbi:PD-(D/E)XK nuclease family protein [Lysobacter sp. Hz 25]|uniref:PD-(D/E)XK nuclease family protein n=1 Tax=Lysobacter sp. Hz 25 TaxID=3383698 RepID=UPI0038D45ECE
MLDFNTHDLSDHLGTLVDAAMEREAALHPPRTYLGASSLGEDCARRLQFQYFNAPKDVGRHFPGRLLRVFARGHRVEDWMAEWLRLAGFELRTRNEKDEQFGFATAEGRVRGHADGVVVAGPDSFSYPMLWECKCVGNKTFRELQKKKLAASRPVYAAQVALYQAYLGLHEHPALFTAICADNMEIYAERVVFDRGLAQRASDRAVQILRACDAAELLPRISTTPTHQTCRDCPWQDRCWALPFSPTSH